MGFEYMRTFGFMPRFHRCGWMLCIKAYPNAQSLYIEYKLYYHRPWVCRMHANLTDQTLCHQLSSPAIANETMWVLVV